MSAITNATAVATIASPSTNSNVAVLIGGEGVHRPLIGRMLLLEQPVHAYGTLTKELALGTVTEMTTQNANLESNQMRFPGGRTGWQEKLAGPNNDARSASISVQACYRWNPTRDMWVQAGNTLSASPDTGLVMREVDNAVLDEVISADNLHYAGYMAHSAAQGTNIRVPLNIDDFSGPEGARHMSFFGISGSGKALALDTPIPTPTGWSTMGELRDGDLVLDEMGQPCRVVKAHDVLVGRECFEVKFSDGTVIVADGEHLWFTHDGNERRRAGNHERLEGRRKRRTILPARVLTRLRRMRAAVSDDDRLVLQDLVKATGWERHWLEQALLVAQVPGTPDRRTVQRRAAKEHVRQGSVMGYPAHEALQALTRQFADTSQRVVVDRERVVRRLQRAAVSPGLPSHLTLGQIADICDLPRRNASLVRRLRRAGLESQVVTQAVAVRRGTDNPLPSHRMSFPARAALDAVIQRGERLVGDQRMNRGEVRGAVRTTRDIAASLVGQSGEVNHSVPLAGALQLPARDLLVDPYVLGAWLGDGNSDAASITTVDQQVLDHLRARGVESIGNDRTGIHYSMRLADTANSPEDGTPGECRHCGEPTKGGARIHLRCRPYTSLRGRLNILGVLNNKHVPMEYLRASEEQRRDLLAGLLDTDGTVAPSGATQFDNTNHSLVLAVYELLASLGYRPTVTQKNATLNGEVVGPVWRVSVTTRDNLFRLDRKVQALRERTQRHNPRKTRLRYIVDVRSVTSVPVRCITVDSPNNLYLASNAMIPTHNTAASALTLAGQLRFPDHGMVIIDPQGQWSHEAGMPWSFQGFAAELGRQVIVKRISEDLRLEKDATLLGTLLGKTKFIREIMRMGAENAEILLEELAKVTRAVDDWESMSSEDLLVALLTQLNTATVLQKVYATTDKQDRLAEALLELATDPVRRSDVLRYFAPLHNLFQPTNPKGETRDSLWATLSGVFDKEARAGRPAPVLILDMSTSEVSWVSDLLADDDELAAREALSVLDSDGIKAAILRQTCRTLKFASEAAFRGGANLNTMVVFDEAWRFAPSPSQASDPEVAELSTDLAGYARDTRKFGIGWTYITQTPRSLNPDIWDQLSIRVVGYGLAGAELDRVAEQLDDRAHLRLYKGFAPPASTNPRIYPFMMLGPVSPLSFTKAPVFVAMYTSFDEFRSDNHAWIEACCREAGTAPRTGDPIKPGAAATRKLVKRASGRDKKAEERVKEHKDTGGVDRSQFTHLTHDPGFSQGLNAIFDTDPPTSTTGPHGRPVDPATGQEFPF